MLIESNSDLTTRFAIQSQNTHVKVHVKERCMLSM